MLLIVVSLEGNTDEDLVNVLDIPPSAWRQFKHARDLVQSEALVVLKQGAADAPHITRVAPPQLCRRERRDHETDLSLLFSSQVGHLIPSMTSGAR